MSVAVLQYQLTPDEDEFIIYIKNHPSFFSKYININNNFIQYIGLSCNTRFFIVGFQSRQKRDNISLKKILIFKLKHNHNDFQIYNVFFVNDIKKHFKKDDYILNVYQKERSFYLL